MTDNRFIDIESLEGQAELIARTRRAVDEIGEVQACSPDDLVRVTVAVSGLVTDVDLADETVRLDREELGRLIAATAQKASQLMAAKVAEAMAEVHRLQELLLADSTVSTLLQPRLSAASLPILALMKYQAT